MRNNKPPVGLADNEDEFGRTFKAAQRNPFDDAAFGLDDDDDDADDEPTPTQMGCRYHRPSHGDNAATLELIVTTLLVVGAFVFGLSLVTWLLSW